MNTLSPVVSDALSLLRQDLYLHLDEAEAHASSYTRWSEADIDRARALIQDLVTVIRGVVALHDTAGARGHCRVCDGIWPCKAFETIHRLVKDPNAEFTKIIKVFDNKALLAATPTGRRQQHDHFTGTDGLVSTRS